MVVRSSNQVTRWLLEWSGGDQAALDQLMPVVYDELHRVAAAYLKREQVGHTLQPTALVHEAYLRLVVESHVDWQSRAHFFGVAARLMRQILVDHARRRHAAKRGDTDKQSLRARARLLHLYSLWGKPDKLAAYRAAGN